MVSFVEVEVSLIQMNPTFWAGNSPVSVTLMGIKDMCHESGTMRGQTDSFRVGGSSQSIHPILLEPG